MKMRKRRKVTGSKYTNKHKKEGRKMYFYYIKSCGWGKVKYSVIFSLLQTHTNTSIVSKRGFSLHHRHIFHSSFCICENERFQRGHGRGRIYVCCIITTCFLIKNIDFCALTTGIFTCQQGYLVLFVKIISELKFNQFLIILNLNWSRIFFYLL